MSKIKYDKGQVLANRDHRDLTILWVSPEREVCIAEWGTGGTVTYSQAELDRLGYEPKVRNPEEMERLLMNEDNISFCHMPKDVQDALKELGPEGTEGRSGGRWCKHNIPVEDWNIGAYRKKVVNFTIEEAAAKLHTLLGYQVGITHD